MDFYITQIILKVNTHKFVNKQEHKIYKVLDKGGIIVMDAKAILSEQSVIPTVSPIKSLTLESVN